MNNCRNCQNWNDGTGDCAIFERYIDNNWPIPEDVQAALDLPSQDDVNECTHYIEQPPRYIQVSIQPASGGFGEYDVLPDTSEPYDSESDLLDAMSDNVELFELGIDELPDGMEDIRGRIHNQPERVFGYIEDGQVIYTGINSF